MMPSRWRLTAGNLPRGVVAIIRPLGGTVRTVDLPSASASASASYAPLGATTDGGRLE